MTTMRRLSLSLSCVCLLGFAPHLSGDVEAKGKKKSNKEDTKAAEPIEAGDKDVPKAPASAEPVPSPAVGSSGFDKGFFIAGNADGPNRLHLHGRVNALFAFTSEEAGADRLNSHAFSIPAARLAMKGSVYTKRLSFKFQSAFGKGRVDLKDFYIDYRVGSGETRVRAGQFKKPFSRQQLTSSSKQEFVGRSIVDGYFDNGRDIGLQVHSGFANSSSTEWAVGVFNGTGASGTFSPAVEVNPATMNSEVVGGSFSNIPNKVRPTLVTRLGHNGNGIKGYSEADLEGGDLRYAVAVATMTDFHLGFNSAAVRAGADMVVKQSGFSATGGVYVSLEGAPKVQDVEYVGLGAYVQTGYVMSGKYQPALRYAIVTVEGGDSRQEIGGVFSVYEFKHGLKWQTDLTLLDTDEGARRKDFRGRTQVQLAF